MSAYVPRFQSFFRFFLHYYVLAKLATSSIRVKGFVKSALFLVIPKGIKDANGTCQ